MSYDVIVDAAIMFYGESRRHRAARRRLSARARPQRATGRANNAIDLAILNPSAERTGHWE